MVTVIAFVGVIVGVVWFLGKFNSRREQHFYENVLLDSRRKRMESRAMETRGVE